MTPFHIVHSSPDQKHTQDGERNQNRARRSLKRPSFPSAVIYQTISLPPPTPSRSFPHEGKGTGEMTVWETAFYLAATKFFLRPRWFFTRPGGRRQAEGNTNLLNWALQQLNGIIILERPPSPFKRASQAFQSVSNMRRNTFQDSATPVLIQHANADAFFSYCKA